MKPCCYLDVEVRSAVNSLPVVARVVNVLHGMLRQSPGLFALAFPGIRAGDGRHPGNRVRIFTGTVESAGQVLAYLANNERLQGHVRYGKIGQVPDDFAGEWVEYRRYRVPGRSSRLDKCREYRLQAAAQLPFIHTVSKTNGHGFSLHVAAVPGEPSQSCAPDSYGLSVASRPFALPVV